MGSGGAHDHWTRDSNLDHRSTAPDRNPKEFFGFHEWHSLVKEIQKRVRSACLERSAWSERNARSERNAYEAI